jgi:hypothetical protein
VGIVPQTGNNPAQTFLFGAAIVRAARRRRSRLFDDDERGSINTDVHGGALAHAEI